MKKLITLLFLVLSFSIMARNDLDLSTFSAHMNDHIDAVAQDNPEIYEKNKASKGRFPASVQPLEEVPVEKVEEGTGLEHPVGQKEW